MCAALSPVAAQVANPKPDVRLAALERGTKFLALGIGKSVVVELPRETKDVLVPTPDRQAVVRSARRAYLIALPRDRPASCSSTPRDGRSSPMTSR